MLVKQTIADKGYVALFVPPYSPEFNPIELVFGVIKNSFYRLTEQQATMQASLGSSIHGLSWSNNRRGVATNLSRREGAGAVREQGELRDSTQCSSQPRSCYLTGGFGVIP